jgi:glycosyltransferase involved in cell wall biosynthesis
MNETISVITPVHEPSLPYLPDAYDSLCMQLDDIRWAWEWVVQLDGIHDGSAVLPGPILRDSRVSVRSNRAGGPGVARTTALARTRGGLVRNLDADDRLLDGALARDFEVLAGDQTLGWTVSKALDLLPDGTLKGWDFEDPIEGRIAIGSVLDFWVSHQWRLPILPGTLCMRRELVLALGGWMAMPTSEDTGLVMAANAVSDGFFIGEPSLAYRKHDAQATAQEYHINTRDVQARRELIVQRATVLRVLAEDADSYPWWSPRRDVPRC